MITTDQALAIAREHLAQGISAGGLVTMYRFANHWAANCSFPDGRGLGKAKNQWVKISVEDGTVTVDAA
jgi:hypothetical protein